MGDPTGMVLDTITDDTFRTTAEAKNIRAGGLWGELQQGTNALGSGIGHESAGHSPRPRAFLQDA